MKLFWVFKIGHRQLWRAALVVFLLSFTLSSLWQLMVPPQYRAGDLSGALSPSYAVVPAVKWQWSDLLVQGFPWLRSIAPLAFQEPWHQLQRLLELCIGFVPGDSLHTLSLGIPWLQQQAGEVILNPLPEDPSILDSKVTEMQVLSESAAEISASQDESMLFSNSLLPVFSEAEVLALVGDLAPKPDTTEKSVAVAADLVRSSDKPPILIFHTHNAEAYEGSGDSRYVYNNDERTVIHVGAVLTARLAEMGVPVVHNRTHHMDANFNLAYVQARRSLQAELGQQQFSMVLDLHNDGTNLEITTCDIDGLRYARLLFVIGKAEGIGSSWKLNESFAQAIHQGLQNSAPGLSRGLYYEPGVRYNQDAHPASLIIEVGGNENSLEEALRSIDYLASVLADLYFNGW